MERNKYQGILIAFKREKNYVYVDLEEKTSKLKKLYF